MLATGDGVKPAGPTAAGLGMVLIAAPMLARRAAALAALGGLFAALVFTRAVFGAHTRCGVVLPITGFLSFAASRRARGSGRALYDDRLRGATRVTRSRWT